MFNRSLVSKVLFQMLNLEKEKKMNDKYMNVFKTELYCQNIFPFLYLLNIFVI